MVRAEFNEAFDRWLAALEARHRASLTTPEFLKAVRALSARYVERRDELMRRSPLDSAGKRAAFAAFFAPLHFLITANVVRALGADRMPLRSIVDLGCGTGAGSAAWATAHQASPAVLGIDRDSWALDEARWNWRALGASGRVKRGDLLQYLRAPGARRGDRDAGTALLAAWSVNELDATTRAAVLPQLLAGARGGAAVLIVEPISRRAVPWWPEWSSAFLEAGGRADEWTFSDPLPARLAAVDEAAGFQRDALKARTLFVGGPSPEPSTSSRKGLPA